MVTRTFGVPYNPPTQSAVTRALDTPWQSDASRWTFGAYSVQMTVTASIASGQDGFCVLEIADDAAFTLNVQSLMETPGSQTYTLAVALQGVQKSPANVVGWIPPAKWARLRTVASIGAPAWVYRRGQELLTN